MPGALTSLTGGAPCAAPVPVTVTTAAGGATFLGSLLIVLANLSADLLRPVLDKRLADGGYRLLDTQFVTDHLRRFGAIEVSRETYRRSLRHALATSAIFYSDGGAVPSVPPWAPAGSSTGPWQSSTQRS